MVWWVAPSFPLSKIAWRLLIRLVPFDLVESVNRTELRIVLKNGSEIWVKSADNPDSLRGEGLTFLVVDEAAMVRREAWENALRPALTDRAGRAVFISTPKGHNWFYGLWVRGEDEEYVDYESFKFPTESNPYIPGEDIEESRVTLPDAVYRQEFLAEFLENVGTVFRGVQQCIKGSLAGPEIDTSYTAGVDFAKHQDFTVICVLDQNGHLVGFGRWREVNWELQLQRVREIAKLYSDCPCLIDSTGIGDVIFDGLHRAGVRVEGYKFTQPSKARIIENLSSMIEQGQISFPEIPELVNELTLYTYKTGRTGLLSYGAPEGYHDDIVVALALAAWKYRGGLRKPSWIVA